MSAPAYFPVSVNKCAWLTSHVFDLMTTKNEHRVFSVPDVSQLWLSFFFLKSNTHLSSRGSSGSNHSLDHSHQHGYSHSAHDTPTHRCHPDKDKNSSYNSTHGHIVTLQVCASVKRQTYRAGFITVLSPPPRWACTGAIYRVTCSSIAT